MNRNRIFRLLICLILVCCLLVQISPIRAKALFVADDLAIGYAALLILAACGVIFCPTTVQEVTAIGNSMTKELREWGKATSKETDVELWIAGMTLYDALGGDEDDPFDPNGQKIEIARAILAGMTAWVCSVVLATTEVEVEEEAEVGFAYYNGVLMPEIFPDYANLPNRFLCYEPASGSYYAVATNCSVTYSTYTPLATDFMCFDCTPVTVSGSSAIYVQRKLDDMSWTYFKSNSNFSSAVVLGSKVSSYVYNDLIWIWSNFDIVDNVNGGTYPATEPVDFLTTILYPETYVGDIPQKIIDGEEDEETLVIPDINYGALIPDGMTLEESLQNTMQQLKDGTLTYDEFMEQIRVEEETETDPDPSEDPSEDPTTSVDGSTTDPTAYALDLSNYFPFCIPFDLYDFLACLNADPVTPVIEWELALPGGGSIPIELDLSPFDSVAKLLRRLQLLVFIIGLAFKTRDLIKG